MALLPFRLGGGRAVVFMLVHSAGARSAPGFVMVFLLTMLAALVGLVRTNPGGVMEA